MDRNSNASGAGAEVIPSLSARRAWIEIDFRYCNDYEHYVALRKESVDRNHDLLFLILEGMQSLSARRAWIEIGWVLVA